MSIVTLQHESTTLLFPELSIQSEPIQSKWFDSEHWLQQNKISGKSVGRYTTWFIDPPTGFFDQQWVLRHYYRGGLISKFNKDKFFFNGLKKTRAYRELSLHTKMKQLGLPVPKVIGARIKRKGLFYTADLLMEKIEAPDLITLLKNKVLSSRIWSQIGATIAQFHNNGIYHSDLNSHNILIEESGDKDSSKEPKIWLIDFDRCEQKTINNKTEHQRRYSWQQNNLARLYRSLFKEKRFFSELNFNDDDWSALTQGYIIQAK